MDAKIGQMIVTGFRGLEAAAGSPIVKDIEKGLVGGVLLFDRDVALAQEIRNIGSPGQVRDLIATLQDHAAMPLLVGVDQEGGMVRRLKPDKGFPPLPAAEELGKRDDPNLTAGFAEQTAAALSSLGINFNLAPVVDLNLNPENPVIGRLGRSFSADPETVVRHARAVIAAHRRQGVATVLKHFPGHGSSAGDSHCELPDVSDSWREIELEPFRAIIAAGDADAVMTAHIYHSRLDPLRPATLSLQIIGGLLRDRLGFDGVVISDDLNMKAIADHFGLEKAVKMAVNSGVDILTFGNNLVYDEEIAPKVAAIIRKLLRAGEISSERIEESYRRILTLKKRLGLLG